MRKLSIIFGIVLLVSMFLPQVTFADKKTEVVTFSAGVPIVVDNNVDVTYTGKTWKENGDNKYEYVARISQAPIYNDDGSLVDCSWHGSEDAYVIVNNVFSAQVIGTYITTTYQGQSMSWNPVVLVDSKEYAAKGFPTVLAVDPINSYYKNNTLEWDYGVCVRRVRVIEGLIQETWIFDKDPKGTVWIKDNAQKSSGFEWAISPYAYDANNNPITINEYKQVSAKDLANAVYPVTIDPTEVYVTSASDGWNTVYAGFSTAWATVSATSRDSSASYTVIGMDSAGYGDIVSLYRSYVYFDTSAIPDSATISAVNLSVYGETDGSVTNFNISVQSGMPTYPHDPTTAADYDKSLYTSICNAGFNTTGFSTSGYNNISFNSTGISVISLTGTTKLCLRNYEDIIGSSPANLDEYVRVWTYEKGAGYRPTLYVTYSSSGVPTVTTNPATYVTKTTAQLNGYVNADGGEASNVSFNYLKWYNAGWRDCIEFTINHSYVSSDLTNFPVLVTGSQLNTTDPDFWTTVNSSGSDILFTDSNNVKLNRELVSIDTSAKTMECYVNVTSVSGSANTKFYMYYNSANISLYNESNSTATWDGNYLLVTHLNDNPNTSAVQDSTISNFDGTKVGAAEPAEIVGNFGGDKAQDFDGTNDYIKFGNNCGFEYNESFTIETILLFDNVNDSGHIVGKGDHDYFPSWSLSHATNTVSSLLVYSWTTETLLKRMTTLTNGTWVALSTKYGGNNNASSIYLYKNAIDIGYDYYLNNSIAHSIKTTNQLSVGAIEDGAATTNYLDGKISEVRISNISRSVEWVKATHNTLLLPTSFAPVTDVFTSTATQSKNTGDSWYTSQTGLTANTLYGYKAEGVNSYGTSWGAWVFFNTSVTLNPPSNVICNAGADSISLSWTKGGNSSYTYIRYKVGSYPTSTTDGNAVANQSGVNFTHTGLASGTSYFYRLWGEDGGTLSTTNVTTVCTTTASSTVSTPSPLPTLDTSGATTSPNGSALTNNPLYTLGNQEAAAISVPQGTWWMLVGLGILIVTGLFIYTRSRNLLIALGAMIIAGVVMANMDMFPIWIMYVFGLAGIGMSWKELR